MSKILQDTYVAGFSPKGVLSTTIFKQRVKMFKQFTKAFTIDEHISVLDVGVSADTEYVFSNYFEEFYPYKNKITTLGLFDCTFLEERYKGLCFVQGNGLNLPFEDNSIDLVFSSATIEHVGSFENQKRFIEEAIRVAKKGVYITTPNRWHPIDFHTSIPLLHYLPKKMHRTLLKMLRKDELAKEENLNLMTTANFKQILKKSKYHYSFRYNYFLSMRANILVSIKKQ